MTDKTKAPAPAGAQGLERRHSWQTDDNQTSKTPSHGQRSRVDFTALNGNVLTVSPTQRLEAGKGGEGGE
jgi:hypothetical protein